MRFATLNAGRAGVCLAIWFLAALDAPAQGIGYSDLLDRRNFQQSTYHIRVPFFTDPGYLVPAVVILHDAGRNGASIIDNQRLIEAFVGKGYAVVAPDALPRANARISYGGDKPSLMELESFVLPFKYSKRKFLMIDIDENIRYLKFKTDSGWYFYNVDRVKYSRGRPEFELLGRDEIQNLRNVLAHAAEEYGIDPEPVLVIGLGHGGSLVWQIACHAPNLGQILAPVGGAFWREIPENCEPGAHLVHTHHRESAFWPLEGAKGNKKRYARTSIYRNLDMLLRENRCTAGATTDRNNDLGLSQTTWEDCPGGGPVELMVLDDAFAFQTWWLDGMLDRVERTDTERPPEAPEAPLETGPVVKAPGAATGFKTPGAGTGFKTPGSGSGFKAAGAGTESRFKRAK